MNEMVGSEAKPGDVILARDCWIEGPDGEVSPLTLRFTRPVREDENHVRGTLRIECKYFSKIERAIGQDDLHVLCMLLWIGRILLENREDDGYSIWWQEKGDLHYFDFWMGYQYQQEFCLPSDRTRAKREAFYEANRGKTLMPTHSVAFEPDRPAITVYRIQKDGSETLGQVIGPAEIGDQTLSGLAEVVGKAIFWSSSELVKMLDKIGANRKAEPEQT